ncbi:hypothetical protein FBALC1_17097 [Flavobacteriales bacterium ALC-1]|nr:hypothetical protein FBALC1_17097 [Flavobacteriales bacterium ALC-1]
MKTKNTMLIVILGLLLLNLFNRQCNRIDKKEAPKISIIRDTIWQTKIDTFKVQTTTYKTVYVSKGDTSKIVERLPQKIDTSLFVKARIYRDTLSNNDIDIFSYNLLEGNLLDSEIAYKLKVPREITVTKTIEYPKTYRSGLYVFSEFGGNTNTFDNISLGLQYNRKGKWFVSYRMNLNQLPKPTYNIGVGFRLIK